MANIQPFDYQERTNIEEHNQIVNKVNEIVEVINNVNLDTINSEIATLKSNAIATDTEIANIKTKDTTQDTEINGITKNLVSNVTATFDNPSRELRISLGREVSPSIDATVVIPASSETGQYSAGNGITIDNYQIAVDTNVVALKTDIPVVPDVSNLTERVTILETEMPTKASVDDVNSKVAIAQGTENVGKVLGIGADGNVTPVVAGGSSGGGEVWEEITSENWPTDWVVGDRVRIIPNIKYNSLTNNSWTTAISIETPEKSKNGSQTLEYELNNEGVLLYSLYWINITSTAGISYNSFAIYPLVSSWNSGEWLGTIYSGVFNGKENKKINSVNVGISNMPTYIYKMWRLKKLS